MSGTASVIVASTSAAAGTNPDGTGPLIKQWLEEQGFSTSLQVVADGTPTGEAVRTAVAAGTSVIITTGGTGVSPSDLTPEQVEPLLEVQLPGIIEAVRARGMASTPMACITRGVAGFAGQSFIATLPGSASAVRDGLAVLEPILHHLLAQRSGRGGHGKR